MSLFRKHDVVRHNFRITQTFQIHLTSGHIIKNQFNEDLDIRRYVSYVLDKLSLITKRHPSAPTILLGNRKRRASYTVEAAIILPVLVGLMAGIMMFFWILIIQFGTGYAIHSAVRQYALTVREPNLAVVVAECDAAILQNKVPLNYIKGKYVGLDYSASSCENGSIDICLRYSIPIPLIMLGRHVIRIEQHAVARCWNGYDPSEDMDEEQIVYVTKRGVAYHKSLSCPYLDLSIRTITRQSLSTQRNKDDGKYYACEACDDGESEYVYITDYGDRYHSSLSCTGLKRSIKAIKLTDAAAYHACDKCAS